MSKASPHFFCSLETQFLFSYQYNMPIRWSTLLLGWRANIIENPKRHSTSIVWEDPIGAVLYGFLLLHNVDIHIVVVRIQRIYDTFLLWPYPYASELSGVGEAPSLFGYLTFLVVLYWRLNLVWELKRNQNNHDWSKVLAKVRTPPCVSLHTLSWYCWVQAIWAGANISHRR